MLYAVFPRASVEQIYGISIRKPKEGEDAHRPPTDLELLNAYGGLKWPAYMYFHMDFVLFVLVRDYCDG